MEARSLEAISFRLLMTKETDKYGFKNSINLPRHHASEVSTFFDFTMLIFISSRSCSNWRTVLTANTIGSCSARRGPLFGCLFYDFSYKCKYAERVMCTQYALSYDFSTLANHHKATRVRREDTTNTRRVCRRSARGTLEAVGVLAPFITV